MGWRDEQTIYYRLKRKHPQMRRIFLHVVYVQYTLYSDITPQLNATVAAAAAAVKHRHLSLAVYFIFRKCKKSLF